MASRIELQRVSLERKKATKLLVALSDSGRKTPRSSLTRLMIPTTGIGVFDRRQNVPLISTSDGKHLRGNMHTGGRSCSNRLRPLLPHHSMRADVLGE